MRCYTDDVLDTNNGCDDDVTAETFDGGCVLRCWLKHVNVRDNLCSSYIVEYL